MIGHQASPCRNSEGVLGSGYRAARTAPVTFDVGSYCRGYRPHMDNNRRYLPVSIVCVECLCLYRLSAWIACVDYLPPRPRPFSTPVSSSYVNADAASIVCACTRSNYNLRLSTYVVRVGGPCRCSCRLFHTVAADSSAPPTVPVTTSCVCLTARDRVRVGVHRLFPACILHSSER